MLPFSFDIDVAIVIVFLIVNLSMGLYHAHGKTTLREYAVGDKNFSTATLSATIIATCIGGGFFSGAITESYKQGLYFIIPAMGEPLCLIIIGYFLIPRMAEFLGDLSVADSLGNLYGNAVRIICAISGIFLCIGIVALQFKVGASILGVFFGISGFYATLLCAIVVTFYSAFGGVKAVTFTDIMQFFTFGTIIPIISLTIWGTLNDPESVFLTLSQNPLFDYRQVFDLSNPKFVSTVFLLAFFLVPDFQPVFFQRVIMARNILQGRQAFIIGGLVCLSLLLVISLIGVLLLSSNNEIDPNKLLPYIISKYSYAGLKGITAIGVMAIIMSTADSYINSAAVLFTNDLLKPLNLKKIAIKDLVAASIFSFFIGILGFFIAFKSDSILELLLFIFSFYAPIVTAPLLLTIFGFRSTGKSVIIGMIAGSITVIICNILDISETIIPDLSMLMNIIFFIGSHYILKQKGGWVGIKNPEPVEMIRLERRRKLKNLMKSIKDFSLINFLRNNCPKQDHIYTFLGLFCIISVFSTIYSMPKALEYQEKLVVIIYNSVLLYSSIFLMFPIWPSIFKSEKFMIFAWNIGVPYILLFCPALLMIISNFGQFQLMILMLNIIVIAILFRWQVVILMMTISIYLAIKFYKWFIGVDNIDLNLGTLQFKIMYMLLLVSSIIIAFLKPKQQKEERSELIKDFLYDENKQAQLELLEMSRYRKDFIDKLNNRAIGLFKSTSQQLKNICEDLNHIDKSDIERKKKEIENAVEKITTGVDRLDQIIFEVQDSVKINLQPISLETFIHDLIDEYKKLTEHKEYISIVFEGKKKDIFFDPVLIKKSIATCLNHATEHSKANTKLSIVIDDTQLRYRKYFDDIKVSRDGIKISIILEHTDLEQKALNKLLYPNLTSIENANFADLHRIAYGHYGDFNIFLTKSKSIIYSISIPKDLNQIFDVRVPSKTIQGPDEVAILVDQATKSCLNRVAINLIRSGVDMSLVSKITGLSNLELESLAENAE